MAQIKSLLALLHPSMREIWIAGLVMIVVLLANAPASLLKPVLEQLPPKSSYAYLEGKLWNGQVRGLIVDGAPVGNLSFRISPLKLLFGRVAILAEVKDGAVEGGAHATITAGRRVTVRNLNLQGDLHSLMRRYHMFGEPITGSFKITAQEVLYDLEEGCLQTFGEGWTDVLQAPSRKWGGDGFDLQGPITCEGRALQFALAGSGQDGSAGLSLRLQPDLSYKIDASVVPLSHDIDQALRLIGFEQDTKGLRYISSGIFQGV